VKPLEAAGLAWVDGCMVNADAAWVSLTEPAIQAGLGVFETVAVRAGAPIDLQPHLERLAAGAARLGIVLPERGVLAAAAQAVAAGVPEGFGWLKLSRARTGPCVVWGGPLDPNEDGRAVSAVLLPWRQNAHDAVAGLKTLNYANHILGLEEAERRGADEGIWLNTRGHLAEGCTSTLFLIRRRALYTPSVADGVLPGIVRTFVLRAAREMRLPVHEGKIRLKRLLDADEAFLTSSLRGVRPLVRFDGRQVGKGAPGPITRAISARVAELRGLPPGPTT
jgi:branched-subunit amino acid aminotransferase/4-amino-4-deoxychorismate lyase